MVSDSGDYLGNGVARRWSSGNATITASGSSAGLTVKASGGTSGDEYTFGFWPPSGGQLAPGSYDNAQGQLNAPWPAVYAGGAGRGCNRNFGRFVVHDFDVSGSTINRVWIDYEIHCDYGPLASYGEIRINEPGDPDVYVAPANAFFPDRYPGAPSPRTLPIWVQNTSGSAVALGAAAIQDDTEGVFRVAHDGCARSLAPGAGCTVDVDFLPQSAGDKAARLVLPAGTAAGQYVVPLSGRGIAGHTSWDFTSEPGDPVGKGESGSYTPANAKITANATGTTYINASLVFDYDAQLLTTFTPGSGQALTAGKTYTTGDLNGPQISLKFRGVLCDHALGSFTIDEYVREGDRIRKLSLHFDARCNGGSGRFVSSFAYQATNPATPLPPSSGPTPTPSPSPSSGPAAEPVGAPASTPRLMVLASDPDGDGYNNIDVVDLDTRRRTTLLHADPAHEVTDDAPELSPDGTKIVLSSDRGWEVPAIFVLDRRDGSMKRVTDPPAMTIGRPRMDIEPHWSPDGSRILFTRLTLDPAHDAAATDGLLWVPADGGMPTRIPQAEHALSGDWSPDGHSVVFADLPTGDIDEVQGNLITEHIDGSNESSLGAVGSEPTWSPDGSAIAYATYTYRDQDRDRAADVQQIAWVSASGAAGGPFTQSRPGGAFTYADNPAWAPDSNSVLFDLSAYDSSGDLSPAEVWGVDRSDRRSGPVLTDVPDVADEYSPDVIGPGRTPITSGTPSRYVAVAPQRVLDTRSTSRVGPGGVVSVPVRGLMLGGSRVPDDVTAVVLTITAPGASAGTDVRAYPSGGGVPVVSNLNLGRGATVANLATVPVGADGAVLLRNNSGSVHLIADIAGYYVSSSGGDGFAAVNPSRVLDTRNGGTAGRVGPGGTVDLQVTGTSVPRGDGNADVVPADATAVVLNVTATSATAATDVRVYPTGSGDVPVVSNLNLSAGQTVANLVTVKIGPDGKVRLRNQSGSVHLIADIAGYYAPSAAGRFVPAGPARMLDTRNGIGAAPVTSVDGDVVELQVAGTRALPAAVAAVALNVTATAATASTDVRVYPGGPGSFVPPNVSNLNVVRGVTRANFAVVKVGSDGRVLVRNNTGELHLLADVAGYFV
jgi:hypothetical protein